MTMTPISLKMPRRLAAELSEAARRRGVSRSALIRQAVEAFLRAEEAGEHMSAFSRAADFAGAFPGPTDLSVNREYMRGFGQ